MSNANRKSLKDSMKIMQKKRKMEKSGSKKNIDKALESMGVPHAIGEVNEGIGLRRGREKEAEKHRVTHYLSKKSLEQLEGIYDSLKRSLPYEYKTKIKKSHLIEFGLQMLIDDFRTSGNHSQVFVRLISPYLED